MKKKLQTLFNIFRRGEKVVGLPMHIQVETTNACNLRCASCHRDILYPEPAIMRFETFKKVYDEIKSEKINVSGLGEPFLNNDIFKIIKYAKDQGSAVNCATNFTLVEGKIDQVFESGIDQLKVSIDASSKESFLKIRAKDMFEVLVNNIKTLNRIKNDRGTNKPAIRFNYALQNDNIDELCDTIELANSLNIKAMYIQYLEYIEREERKTRLVGNITLDKLKKTLMKADEITGKYGITTNINIWMRDLDIFWNKMLPSEQFIPNKRPCYFPWFTSWIDADGTVRPCPIIPWQRDVGHMGNIFQEPFKKIWNNDKYKELRAALARGERPTEPCRTCIPQGLSNIFHIGTKLLPN
ncbi:MAG: radical SAM protein [Candidatus Scalindua sp.]|nr:radical SAM protein [Candidatus Scalindua sp.]